MIKKEWKFIGHNRLILVSLCAIMLIPFLYSIFFLRSVWDPYGETQHLPVAVVNEDKPVVYEGKKLNVGKQTVAKLKKNDKLDWHFVDAKKAKQGLKNRKYYTVVTIPKNFSKNAATVLDKHPKKMILHYETNSSLNYLAEVLSGMGVSTLNSEIRSSVTKAYSSAMFAGLHLMNGQIKQAAQGAGQLNDGSVVLNDGLNQYVAAVSQVNDGVQTLNVSVQPLVGGLEQLQQKVAPLSSSVSQLSNGANQLNAGLQQLQSAVGSSTSGSQQAQLNSVLAALPQINNGLQQLNYTLQNGTNTSALAGLTASLNGIGAQSMTIGSNLQQAEQTLAGMQANGGEGTSSAPSASTVIAQSNQILANAGLDPLTAQQQDAIAQALASNSSEGSGTADLQNNLATVAANLRAAGAANVAIGSYLQQTQQVQPQLQQLSGQLAQLQGSIQQLAGASNLALPGATQAITQLNSGLQSIQGALSGNGSQLGLTSGANQLAGGLNQLNQAVPTLVTGVQQLSSGGQQLGNGVQTLAAGTQALDSNGAALTSGSQELSTGTNQLHQALGQGADTLNKVKPTSKTADMIAAPSKTKQHNYSYVPNYGHALAPYVLSLALYVGALVFNFIYPIRKVAQKGQPAWKWYLSKISVGAVVAVGMAVVEAGLMLVGGLRPDHLGEYFTVAIVFSLCSMYLVMFLAMALDNPGRFLAMILLMLQLGGSGGTFPMQLTNHFYNVIHPYLPMTYSNDAFREALTSGLGSHFFLQAVIVLACIAIVSLALLYISMDLLQRKHLEGKSQLDNNQELQAVEK
ncbi:YhgE/Pip domain-containing protein [Bombilactobacillus thymidiniphilus]|uniref:YhgE/Pip domain-containing protein n=1 Tax=Bombilactobacillus thymidiniphilus TaxID=2923363 RepID=A0ABY4PB78_9LACO|nr:YhgE/Pip domain-containing protein [Bombilactobacillus thymidiniphilus]UQS83028.1 YhgE/Pip domain-containing protein [Bombilactobacillus thymidiniphilus]